MFDLNKTLDIYFYKDVCGIILDLLFDDNHKIDFWLGYYGMVDDVKDKKGSTDVLQGACEGDHMNIAMSIIEEGNVDPNLGMTSACKGGHIELKNKKKFYYNSNVNKICKVSSGQSIS